MEASGWAYFVPYQSDISNALKDLCEKHPVVDIVEVSLLPGFGRATPLSLNRLMTLFGTYEPTRLLIEQKIDEILQLRKRWQATYIIVYRDGLPDQIFFAGYSKDSGVYLPVEKE